MDKNVNWVNVIAAVLVCFFGIWYQIDKSNNNNSEKVKNVESVISRPFELEGLRIPGTATDAKETGFTDCTLSGSDYECKQVNVLSIYGVKPRSSTLHLNGRNHFSYEYDFDFIDVDVRTLPNNGLSYGAITLEFDADSYDEKCISKDSEKTYNTNEQCINNQGITYLINQLKNNGWVETSARRGRTFEHESIPLVIRTDYFSRKNTLEIATKKLSEVTDDLLQISNIEKNQNNLNIQSESFISSMKEIKK